MGYNDSKNFPLGLMYYTVVSQATAVDTVKREESETQPVSSDAQTATVSVHNEESRTSSSLYDEIEEPTLSDNAAEPAYLPLFYHQSDGMLPLKRCSLHPVVDLGILSSVWSQWRARGARAYNRNGVLGRSSNRVQGRVHAQRARGRSAYEAGSL